MCGSCSRLIENTVARQQSVTLVHLLILNPLQANVPFLYPPKMSENLWFFDVFRGYRKGTLTTVVLMTTC